MVNFDEEGTIYITRGDSTTGDINRLAFTYPIKNIETEEVHNYKFKLEDKITFVAMKKKGYTKMEVLRKEYYVKDLGYTEPTECMELPLTATDTKKFPLKNKAQTYWYDLVLNDSVTMYGFDADGGKKIIVYPEVGESGE